MVKIKKCIKVIWRAESVSHYDPDLLPQEAVPLNEQVSFLKKEINFLRKLIDNFLIFVLCKLTGGKI